MYHYIWVSNAPALSQSFSNINTELAICSPDALLGDTVTSSLVRLIEKYSDNLGTVGLRVHDLVVAACASLGARHDVVEKFNFAKADPFGVELMMKEQGIVVRGKAHRAFCSARYVRLMIALAT
jgi:hypothetical protein